jgi:RimJ/RimL family protein N-acetyltransferase
VSDLHLRPWSFSDAAAVVEAFASPDLDAQGGPLATVNAAHAWIERWRTASASGSACAVALVEQGRAVGGVAVSAMDRRHDTGWVSYWLALDVRGRGLAARATATLAEQAFDHLGLFRLELGHRTNNPASCAVASRAGFLAEGVERAKLRYGGERYDTETHARLASDPSPELELIVIT